MKLSVRNMVKMYSVSNIIIDKMYNIINDESINNIMSYDTYDNRIIISLLIINLSIFKISEIKKQKKIISLYKKFYNKDLNKYIDFIGILFIFVFFREIKNAI
jgi:hypothetical protein